VQTARPVAASHTLTVPSSEAVDVRNDNRDRTPPLVRLKALCGPGDQSEPVITIMLPVED